jgi:hypothetical protein
VDFVGDGHVYADQEIAELHAAVAAVQLRDHFTGGDVERGEQASDCVAGIVVGAPFPDSGRHRIDEPWESQHDGSRAT